VVNFSAGFPFFSQALKDTIDNIGTVLVVNAADNGGFDGHGEQQRPCCRLSLQVQLP